MKTILLAATAAVGLMAGFSAPAMAQPYGPPGFDRPGDERPGGWDIARRVHWLQERINRGRDDGSLDRREFYRVNRQLNAVRGEDEAFRRHHGGRLDERVRVDLEARLDHIGDEIHWLREHNERRPW